MRKSFFALICLLAAAPVMLMAQQRPHYTQYLANQFIINPAIAGIENYTDVKISHRHQWVGLEDAPVTTYFTIHGPIGKQDEKESPAGFENPGQNPRGVAYWQQYETSAPHHGWGATILSDRTGPLTNTGAYLSYAYHMGLASNLNISAGLSGGISSITLNRDKLQFLDPNDPAIGASGEFKKVNFDANAGLYLYGANLFAGISAMQIVPQKVSWRDDTLRTEEGKLRPHFFAHAGYRFLIGDDFNFIPSILLKYVSPAPVQPEINARLMYRDKFWTGVGFRNKEGFNATAGLLISQRLNVSYSYDYVTSRLNNYTKGTHEIIIGFLIGNRGPNCPSNIW